MAIRLEALGWQSIWRPSLLMQAANLPFCQFATLAFAMPAWDTRTILPHAENCVDTPLKPWKLTCHFAGTRDRRTVSHWYAPAAVQIGIRSPMELTDQPDHPDQPDHLAHPVPPAAAVFQRVYPRCRSSVTVVRVLPLLRPPRGSSSTCRTPMPPCKEPPIATARVRVRVRGRETQHCETIHNAGWKDPNPYADPMPFSSWSKSPRPCRNMVCGNSTGRKVSAQADKTLVFGEH